MFHSLKQNIAIAVNGFVEKLSPSVSREKEDERPNLKRHRTSQIKFDETTNSDMLVSPPEKRLKKVHEDTGKSVSSFKDFIVASRNARNTFFWRYVVKGETDSILDSREGMEKKMERYKKEGDDKQIDTDLLVAPLVHFKKTEEPKLTFHENPFDAVTRRKTLNPHIASDVNSTALNVQKQADQQDNVISVPFSKQPYKKTVPKPCILEVYRDNKEKLALWNSHRNPSAADTVIRLEERDRYRQLLAQYTTSPSYIDNTLERSSAALRDDVTITSYSRLKSDFDGTVVGRSKNMDVLSSRRDFNFPRLQYADSILKKFSSTLSEVTAASAPLSSSTAGSDAKLFKDASSLVEKRSKGDSTGIRERQRLFSGTDTSNLSRDEQSYEVADNDTLGNVWTMKWRKILQDEELDRQKQIKKEEMKLKSYEKKRKERESELMKKIESRKDLDRKKKEPKLVPLTDEMHRLISSAWRSGNPQERLAEAFNVTITRHDLNTLADLNWLNDEVVNFYFHLLQERSKEKGNLKMHFFNSFFYPKLLKTGYSGVRRWTKKVDIFSVDIVVLPVHLGMHWCLAAIDMRKRQISYYDSLKGNNSQCLAALRNYVSEEHKDKKKAALEISEWSLALPKNIPEQKNGCDCGVFTCQYAECLTRDSSFGFTQTDMPYFRGRMVYEILTKKLL